MKSKAVRYSPYEILNLFLGVEEVFLHVGAELAKRKEEKRVLENSDGQNIAVS